jgi:hypothetical protein
MYRVEFNGSKISIDYDRIGMHMKEKPSNDNFSRSVKKRRCFRANY